MIAERHFYRCHTCTHVFAIDGPQRALCNWHVAYDGRGLLCDCGSHCVEWMGRVGADQSVGYTVERSACDDRCTSARGPKCNCTCRGANHGTHAVVQVTIDNTAATIAPQADLPQRLAQLAEYRAARDGVLARINTHPAAAKMDRGEWVDDRAGWEFVFYGRAAVRKCSSLKTHAARMRAVAKIRTDPNQ